MGVPAVNISVMILLFLLSPGLSRAMDLERFTSKEKSLMTIADGCGSGAAIGSYLSGKADNNDPAKTVLGNTLIGCASGALFSWIFQNDDQEKAVKENAHLKKQISELKRVIASGTHGASGSAKFMDHLKLQERFSGDQALNKLTDPGCNKYRFSLGFTHSSQNEIYIPVSSDVVIRAFEYYVVFPKDTERTDITCVKPAEPFGYLDLEIAGLGDSLFIQAREKLKLQKGKS